MKFRLPAIVMMLLFLTTSCNNNEYSHYISSDNPNKKELEQLFPLLETHSEYTENRFTVMNEIITKMRDFESIGILNLFITDYINNNPKDPYNSYYLLNLASEYINDNQTEFAMQFLHRAVMSYSDLVIRDESTHLKALEILTRETQDEEERVFYYKKMIKEHSERINKRDVYSGGIGEIYFYLAQSLEKIEKWEESIKAYESYLSIPYSQINSEPTARDETLKKVGFYHSDKSWVVQDLDTLVQRVKYAIATRNPSLLDRYRAYDFFIINWKSKYSELKSSYPMESYVLTNMNIKTARELDPMSTESEAYLAVSGNPWSSSIWYVYPTWYFYFQKVDFPMDPEIHGGWEWVGIFLGEKL